MKLYRVGPHLMVVAALEDKPDIGALFGTPPALAYTSPPWSGSAERMYRVKAGADPNRPDFIDLLYDLADVVMASGARAFLCEIGSDNREALGNVMLSSGWACRQKHETSYLAAGKRRPSYVMQFAAGRTSTPCPPKHEDAPAWAIAEFTKPGDLVFDPMVGEGRTALAAEAAGRVCLGIDINAERIETTCRRLAKAGGYEVL